MYSTHICDLNIKRTNFLSWGQYHPLTHFENSWFKVIDLQRELFGLWTEKHALSFTDLISLGFLLKIVSILFALFVLFWLV